MRHGKKVLLGAMFFAAACGGAGGANTEYAQATPDLAGVSLDITGDAATEQLSTVEVVEALGVYESALAGQGPEYLEGARLEVKKLNGALKAAVARMSELVNADLQKTEPGQVVAYGPKDGPEAAWLLKVKKVEEGKYAWKLLAGPLGSKDEAAFKLVGAGGMARAKTDTPHRGRGTLGVNLDNLKLVAPNAKGQGKLMASFAHTPEDSKALSYRLANFTPDTSAHEPVTGAFVGWRALPSKATRIRVLGKWNLQGTATATKENVGVTVRWVPGSGGRADIIATGGDIADGTVYFGAACWDKDEMEKFKLLRKCVRGAAGQAPTCEVVAQVGTRQACPAAELSEDVPLQPPTPREPGDVSQEPGAPATPEAPPADVVAGF